MIHRHDKIGIQREIHLDWLQYAASMHAAGMDKKKARRDFFDYLDRAHQFASPPTHQTKTYISNVLVKTWIAPDADIVSLRGAASDVQTLLTEDRKVIHWALLSAAYPFWFNSAVCVGRLLSLQNQVTQGQVVLRLKEKYGDRQTVSRRARYVIRSMVAWGVLRDADHQGCYEPVDMIAITDYALAALLIEGALLANSEGSAEVRSLLNHPGFFPFQLPSMTGDLIAQYNSRIEVVRYGLDDELLKLRR